MLEPQDGGDYRDDQHHGECTAPEATSLDPSIGCVFVQLKRLLVADDVRHTVRRNLRNGNGPKEDVSDKKVESVANMRIDETTEGRFREERIPDRAQEEPAENCHKSARDVFLL